MNNKKMKNNQTIMMNVIMIFPILSVPTKIVYFSRCVHPISS